MAAVVTYFAYTQYNISTTKELLSESQKHKTAAFDYLNQADSYENNNDYSNALTALEKSSEEINKALEYDKKALNHANGVYQEYADTDIQLLETTIKLIEYKTYACNYKNNSLNPNQEKVAPEKLTPYINNLNGEISQYRDMENQIINAHPSEFDFLK